MDQFLETYKLPKFTQGIIDHLNRPIPMEETEVFPDGFTGECYQTVQEEIISILYNLFQTTEAEEHFLTHSVRPVLPYYQNQIKTLKERQTTNISHEHRCRNSQQILANQIQQCINIIIYHDQVDLSQV